MATVTFDAVRKVYDNGRVAVAGATFEIASGELVVLVGPSGCGKSTLLRMIAGLEAISSGELAIAGERVNELAPRDRDIAMVFQSYALYPHMSVAENLSFGLRLKGTPRAEIERRIADAARMLGLAELLSRRPAELSGGQRQRVAVGRALVRQPKVFLLDEPLSNLDAKLRSATRVEIARLHRQLGATMIYVTHDQVEAMTLGHRIVVMNDGAIEQIDTPLALYARPATLFVAGFLGSPGMNLLRGSAGADGTVLQMADGSRLPLGAGVAATDGEAIVIGLRPEDLLLPAPGVAAAHTGASITATLELAEQIGSETFLHLRLGEQPLVARVAPGAVPPPGTVLQLSYRYDQLHYFGAADGRRRDSRR